jgi:aminoglycoside/choline kinase family phosphotransferase
MNRENLRLQFIAQQGWQDADITALPADASRRRYFRLIRGDDTRLLMDVIPHPEEKFSEYLKIADALCDAGLSAPTVYSADTESGFAMIEDFGDNTFTRLLNQNHNPQELYLLAIDAIAALQRDVQIPNGIGDYHHNILHEEFLRLIDWYYPLWHGARAADNLRAEFASITHDILKQLPALPLVLTLRDFHVDNLMLLADRSGTARCGLLDFQDGLVGNPAYDVLSLLEDARRDVSPALAAACWQHYLAQMQGWNADSLQSAYDILGLQRHGRITGQFIRLWIRDDKPGYLQFMPRVTAQFIAKLQTPVAAPLRDWCAKHLPQLAEKWPDKPAIEFKKIMLSD